MSVIGTIGSSGSWMPDLLISAIIAFCQSLIAPIVFIYLLPVLVGVENIWFAAPAAMVVGAILGTTFLTRKWSKLEEIVDMDDESE